MDTFEGLSCREAPTLHGWPHQVLTEKPGGNPSCSGKGAGSSQMHPELSGLNKACPPGLIWGEGRGKGGAQLSPLQPPCLS